MSIHPVTEELYASSSLQRGGEVVLPDSAVQGKGMGDPSTSGQDGGGSMKHSASSYFQQSKAVRITFSDLSYSVPDRKKRGVQVYLLKGINGFFEPQLMTALMGPSGCGKTTLLDLLAGRKTVGKREGRVLFAGLQPTREYLRRYTGYVEQFDTLLPILTVEEMLMYTAELKRPLQEALENKRAAVDKLIKELGLDECRGVKIGSQMAKGISGGQAKRTNVGLALVTQPRVLFLDEPTTGLDSFTANEVMTCIKELLVKEGVTICATIHSPTSYCFSLFDRIMMLAGGRMVYFGPQGHEAVAFFQSTCPGVKEYTQGYNDAEFLVDLITEADRFGKSEEFAAAYDSSPLCASNRAALEAAVSEGAAQQVPPEVLAELQVKRSTVTPWFWGLWVFIKYRTSKNYRDMAFLAPRVFDKLFIGLLVLTLYLGVGDDLAPDNLINITAVLFMWCGTAGFVAASYIPSLVLERGLFVRERNDGLYLVPTYLTAKLFDELFITALSSLGISAMVFYALTLQGEFVLFYVAYCVASSVGVILAYFVASISPNMETANALLPVYAVTLLFFAGFLIRLDDMPPWWKWYSYLDFCRYSWAACMINQFGGERNVDFIPGVPILQYYGMDGVRGGKWAMVGYTSLFFAFFFIATCLVLQFKKYQVR